MYGGHIKYSFVLMLISLSSLATTSKFQKNIVSKWGQYVYFTYIQENLKVIAIYESGQKNIQA